MIFTIFKKPVDDNNEEILDMKKVRMAILRFNRMYEMVSLIPDLTPKTLDKICVVRNYGRNLFENYKPLFNDKDEDLTEVSSKVRALTNCLRSRGYNLTPYDSVISTKIKDRICLHF